MRIGPALVVLCIALHPLQARQQASLSGSPSGRVVAEYFKTFNSGDTTMMRQFILHHFAQRTMNDVSVSVRLQRYQQFYRMTHGLILQKVALVRGDYIKTIVRGHDGKLLAMEFNFEPEAPHGIIGINIDEDTGEAEVEPAKSDSELIVKTKEYVGRLAAADEFSGVVLIAKNGEPIFQHAWGFADREKRIPNNVETTFNIGSMDKNFTALAIHRLAAEGKLKFSDPIKTFLPDYPNQEAASKVTIGNLLDMTSGIGDFFGKRFIAAHRDTIKSLKDYFPLFADKPLEFEPGEKRRYSNGGFIVLGAIIEKATGMDYYQYITKELLSPIGMTHTDWFERTMLPENCAIGYTYSTGTGRDSVRHPNTGLLPQRGSSAGGGYSNVMDLLNYTRALQRGTFAPTTFEARNGMGIAGGTAGVNAALEWNKERGYTIIVLSNYDPPIAEKISRQLRKMAGI